MTEKRRATILHDVHHNTRRSSPRDDLEIKIAITYARELLSENANVPSELLAASVGVFLLLAGASTENPVHDEYRRVAVQPGRESGETDRTPLERAQAPERADDGLPQNLSPRVVDWSVATVSAVSSQLASRLFNLRIPVDLCHHVTLEQALRFSSKIFNISLVFPTKLIEKLRST